MLPVFTRMLGSLDAKPFLYPVDPHDAAALATQAGVEHLRSRLVDEALRALGLIAEASQLVACYRLRDSRFPREKARDVAVTALKRATESMECVTYSDLRASLAEALQAVEAELDGQRDHSLAAEMQDAVFEQKENDASRQAASVIVAAVDAALRESEDP
jgi:hypothetical protein